jgi:hypothetical protein
MNEYEKIASNFTCSGYKSNILTPEDKFTMLLSENGHFSHVLHMCSIRPSYKKFRDDQIDHKNFMDDLKKIFTNIKLGKISKVFTEFSKIPIEFKFFISALVGNIDAFILFGKDVQLTKDIFFDTGLLDSRYYAFWEDVTDFFSEISSKGINKEYGDEGEYEFWFTYKNIPIIAAIIRGGNVKTVEHVGIEYADLKFIELTCDYTPLEFAALSRSEEMVSYIWNKLYEFNDIKIRSGNIFDCAFDTNNSAFILLKKLEDDYQKSNK